MKGKVTTNQRAAEIIRKFATDRTDDRYEWDDFETHKEENPAVDLAIRLCWYFAARFPGKSQSEYCGQEAVPWFLAIANAVENNLFEPLDYKSVRKSLERNELPEELERLLKKDKSAML